MKTTSAIASTWLIPGLVIICLIAGVASVNSESAPRNKIVGRVTDVDSEEALPGANVAILDTYGGTVTDNQGAFALKNLKDGAYRLQVSHVGYENKIVDSLRLSGGQTLELNIELKKEPVSIKGVIVTPGQYSIMGGEPTPKQILSREIIESRPQLSEDLFRAVQRLPGIAYNDFSAKFNIRGGEQDEVLINLDGMEIYEPFHLKDVDGGVISITDVAAVAGVDLMAGGYPANYGDRMSGVFNITSKTPSSDYNRVSVGLSLMNARFLSEGTFADKRGSWLVSGRRGYLDLVLGLVGQDDEVRPKYYDVFTKLRYKLSSSQTLTASFLRADDDLRYLGEQTDDENNQGDTLLSSYGNTYFWLTLDSYLSSKIAGKTITSIGAVNQERSGQVFNAAGQIPEMRVNDQRDLSQLGVKSDWDFEATKNILLRTGFDYKRLSADYDYRGYSYEYYPGWDPPYTVDSNVVGLHPSGDKVSGYISNRIRYTSFLTSELGVRYDYTSYADDDHFSPRANLAITLSPKTSIKLGWGHFYQVQRLDEINVQDRETDFYNAEMAEHYVAGFEHTFRSGENLRLNVFYKEYSDLRPTYRNTFGELLTFPELEEDRVRVNFSGKTSRGVEVCVKKDIGENVSWWLSYSVAEVTDDIASLYFYNEDVLVNYDKEFPFPYDQLHTLYLDLNYRFKLNWQLNVAWQLHTGWPYTEVFINSYSTGGAPTYFLESEEPWRGRHEHFRRLDLRLNRKFSTSRGTITAFVEVINVLNDENVRNYEWVLVNNDNVLTIEQDKENWFGIMPSFGITYDFKF